MVMKIRPIPAEDLYGVDHEPLVIETPYSKSFIHEWKANIPLTRWLPGLKVWSFSPVYLYRVWKLGLEHFGEVHYEAPQLPLVAEVQLQLAYRGNPKRSGHDPFTCAAASTLQKRAVIRALEGGLGSMEFELEAQDYDVVIDAEAMARWSSRSVPYLEDMLRWEPWPPLSATPLPLQGDYYALLGVTRNANQTAIKKAYRQAAKQHHPDKGGDRDAFERVKLAYETLTDAPARQRYDFGLQLTPTTPPPNNRAQGGLRNCTTNPPQDFPGLVQPPDATYGDLWKLPRSGDVEAVALPFAYENEARTVMAGYHVVVIKAWRRWLVGGGYADSRWKSGGFEYYLDNPF